MSTKKEAVETAAEATAETTAATQEAPQEETRCYIGPPTLGIISGTIYNAGLPPVLEVAIKEQPVIKNLVVPISKLAEANKALSSPDSALTRFYSMAKDYFAKKKGGK